MMESNKDYYALYLKYKSKYLALKTGGAESYEVKSKIKIKTKDQSNDSITITNTFYKTKAGDLKKDDSAYNAIKSDCKQQRNRECTIDEIIQQHEDNIFKNPKYLKMVEEYPKKYPELIETLKKQTQGYINFILEEIKKNEECHKKKFFGIGCEKKFSDAIAKKPIYYTDDFHRKLNNRGYDWLTANGYNSSKWSAFKFRSFADIYKNIEIYKKNPLMSLSYLPLDPINLINMSQEEVIKKYASLYNTYKDVEYI